MGFRRFCRFVVEAQLWGLGGVGVGGRWGGGGGQNIGVRGISMKAIFGDLA